MADENRTPGSSPPGVLRLTPNGSRGHTPQTPPTDALDSELLAAQRSKAVRVLFPRMERVCSPQSGRFWVIGGRPGAFKTQLLWNMALNAARVKQKVLFVTLEASMGEIAILGLARYSGLAAERIREAKRQQGGVAFTGDEQHAYEQGIFELHSVNTWMRLHGTHEHGRGIDDVVRSAGACRFDAVFVDHLGMIGRDRAGSEWETVAKATNALRGLTRGETVRDYTPFVCVSAHLNRDSERDDKGDERLPRMADFRGSSWIEADADMAMILRPKTEGVAEDAPRVVSGFVVKNRHGPCPAVVQFEADGARCLVVERRKDEAGAPPAGHWSDGP